MENNDLLYPFTRPKILVLEKSKLQPRARIMVEINGVMVVKVCDILEDGRFRQEVISRNSELKYLFF